MRAYSGRKWIPRVAGEVVSIHGYDTFIRYAKALDGVI
jgi:hypothetical protein